jgi:hypothetical protein
MPLKYPYTAGDEDSRNGLEPSCSVLAADSPTCSSLITSGRLLDYMTSFQLEFTENIAGVLLTLSKNMLGLIENSLRTWSCAHSI